MAFIKRVKTPKNHFKIQSILIDLIEGKKLEIGAIFLTCHSWYLSKNISTGLRLKISLAKELRCHGESDPK